MNQDLIHLPNIINNEAEPKVHKWEKDFPEKKSWSTTHRATKLVYCTASSNQVLHPELYPPSILLIHQIIIQMLPLKYSYTPSIYHHKKVKKKTQIWHHKIYGQQTDMQENNRIYHICTQSCNAIKCDK
jgi:hypothetical protein